MKLRLFLLLLLFLYTQAFAFDVDELLDVWNMPSEEETVEIEQNITIESQEYEAKQDDKFNIVEFLNFEWDCYITQDEKSHNTKKGGSMFALDISCKDKSFMLARVPQYITGWYYVGRIWTDKYLWDYITLNFWDWYTLVYGHTENYYNLKEWDRITMWMAIGKANISGKTTAKHFHIELWKWGRNITFDLLNENESSYKLRKQRGWLTEEEIKIEEDIVKTAEDKIKNTLEWFVWVFNLTRYYSPVKWQSKYYMWVSREREIRMQCWCRKDWTCHEEDCVYPADWKPLTENDIWVAYACPKVIPLWTKIKLEFDWWTVDWVCRDRWWAIKWMRLDSRCWYWEKWLDNIYNNVNCYTGKAKVFIKK